MEDMVADHAKMTEGMAGSNASGMEEVKRYINLELKMVHQELEEKTKLAANAAKASAYACLACNQPVPMMAGITSPPRERPRTTQHAGFFLPTEPHSSLPQRPRT